MAACQNLFVKVSYWGFLGFLTVSENPVTFARHIRRHIPAKCTYIYIYSRNMPRHIEIALHAIAEATAILHKG